VCDPVPCPTSIAPLVTNAPGRCEPTVTGMECTGRAIHDQIQTQTQGAEVSEALVEATGTPVSFGQLLSGAHEGAVVSSATDSRFCQSNLSLGYRCNDPTTAIADTQLSFDVAQVPSHPWHQITLSGTNGGRGGQWTANYGIDVVDHMWDYADDNAFWASGQVIPPPDSAFAERRAAERYRIRSMIQRSAPG
jgi:hypothetical protein